MKKPAIIVILIISAIFGLAAVVMWLWNFALVPAVNVNPLGYWQAMALLVLSKILFTSFRGGPPGKHWGRKPGWGSKWAGMSPQEKAQFKETWKRRCESRKESS